MPSRTRSLCPQCGETVPSGRLSCRACGALLASVTGGSLRASAGVAATASEAGTPTDDLLAMVPARIQTQTLPAVSADDQTSGHPQPADPGPATPLTPSSIRQTGFVRPGSADATTVPVAPAADGGYLPPGTPLVPATLPASSLAGAPPPAPSVGPAPDVLANELAASPGVLDLARLDPALGYSAAAGSGLIAFGMLMPWSRSVIGATGVGSFFDTWGLVSPGHILVLLAALAVLAVSLLPNRIPVSLRSGLAGLVLGALSLGLVWPYVIGPLGAGVGVMVVTVGGLVLTATGIVSAWRERHAEGHRPV